MTDEKPKFWFNGSMRIMDAPNLHDEIIQVLGEGSECHKKGSPLPKNKNRKWPNDIWLINTPIPEEMDIAEHLKWLCEFVQPYEEQIKEWIEQGAQIDFYFSYCCDHDHCGFGLPADLLDIFPRLGIRMEVSIMT